MSIQSAINQGVGIAAHLLTVSRQRALERAKKDEEIAEEPAKEQKKAEKRALADEMTRAAVLDQQQSRERNFLDYMKDQPTNLGIKFGELPKSAQKELAKAYTPSERQKIMNKGGAAHG